MQMARRRNVRMHLQWGQRYTSERGVQETYIHAIFGYTDSARQDAAEPDGVCEAKVLVTGGKGSSEGGFWKK
jgi:hypothetical protein